MRRCGVATTAHGALRGGARWRVLDLGLAARAWRMRAQGGSAGPIKGGPGILGGRAPEGRPARNPAGFYCASGENGRKVTGPTGGVTASVEWSV